MQHCTSGFAIRAFTHLSVLLMFARSLPLFPKLVIPSYRALALAGGSRLTRRIFIMASTPSEPPLPDAQLPSLSAADFKIYNSMAEHMDYFVSHLHS